MPVNDTATLAAPVILCVATSPSVDKLFEVDELRHGEIHRPRHFVQLPGGKGIHVAQVATALGHPATVTGILAGHAGRWVAEALASEGVAGRFAWGEGETRASLSVADHATGRLTEFYESGTELRPEDWRALEEVVESLLSEASWMAVSGSLLPGAPTDGHARLIAAGRRAGVPVAVDARAQALAPAVAAGPDLVKINIHEAGELLGRVLDGLDDARGAALEIRELAGGEGHAVVITLGEDGMLAVDGDGTAWHGTLPVRGRYPVGSGDTFLAGLLVGLSEDQSWPRAAALALGAAASNAELPGAARIDTARARELAEKATVQRR